MTDNRTTELLRKLLDERGEDYSTTPIGFTVWQQKTSGEIMAWENSDGVLTIWGLTPEQAIAATLGSGMHVYVLRGTDPGSMPSCGGETNELLAVYATREAAEKAKSEWRGYCDLNITEWEVA